MKSALILLTLLMVAGSAASAPDSARTLRVQAPRTESLPLSISRENKPYLQILVNGRPLTVYIDTGAGTIIDLSRAKELGVQLVPSYAGFGFTGEGFMAHEGRIDRLQLGRVTLHGLPVRFVDLTQTRRIYAHQGLPVLDGVLGVDVLSALRASIDFDRSVLTLRRPKQSITVPDADAVREVR
jgi:hypothetical protein